MPTSPHFAKAITAVLVRLAISQREAAKRTRISPGYISNMCLGQVPSLGKLLQFANSLTVDPEPLLAAAGYAPTALSNPTAAEPNAGVPLFTNDAGIRWPMDAREARERYAVPPAFQAMTDFCVRVVGPTCNRGISSASPRNRVRTAVR
jgi:transcriptional regulator with XRE-family HTH domain